MVYVRTEIITIQIGVGVIADLILRWDLKHTALVSVACRHKILSRFGAAVKHHIGASLRRKVLEQDIHPVSVRVTYRICRVACEP